MRHLFTKRRKHKKENSCVKLLVTLVKFGLERIATGRSYVSQQNFGSHRQLSGLVVEEFLRLQISGIPDSFNCNVTHFHTNHSISNIKVEMVAQNGTDLRSSHGHKKKEAYTRLECCFDIAIGATLRKP